MGEDTAAWSAISEVAMKDFCKVCKLNAICLPIGAGNMAKKLEICKCGTVRYNGQLVECCGEVAIHAAADKYIDRLEKERKVELNKRAANMPLGAGAMGAAMGGVGGMSSAFGNMYSMGASTKSVAEQARQQKKSLEQIRDTLMGKDDDDEE